MALVFDDGDIILGFPNLSHRVHKNVLSKVPFFADMFTLATSSDAERDSDGVVRIDMPDDEEGFAVFFRVLYDIE